MDNNMVFICYCIFTLIAAIIIMILAINFFHAKKRERKVLMENKALKTLLREKEGCVLIIEI